MNKMYARTIETQYVIGWDDLCHLKNNDIYTLEQAKERARLEMGKHPSGQDRPRVVVYKLVEVEPIE